MKGLEFKMMEQEPQRPDNYQETLERLIALRDVRGIEPDRFMCDFEIMAKGGNPGLGSEQSPDGVRERFYAGWTDEDFQRLVDDFHASENLGEREGGPRRPSNYKKTLERLVYMRDVEGNESDRFMESFRVMAKGGNPGLGSEESPEGVRDRFYLGWSNDDFQQLINDFESSAQ